MIFINPASDMSSQVIFNPSCCHFFPSKPPP